MSEKKDWCVRLTTRGAMAGRVLARFATGGTTMADCPDESTIAGFIDARLPSADHDRVVAHLADCSQCSSVVTEGLAMREELYIRPRARVKRILITSISASLAAAAVMLLVLRVMHPVGRSDARPVPGPIAKTAPVREAQQPVQGSPSVRSYARELANDLTGIALTSVRASVGRRRGARREGYGFTAIVPREKALFRIGARLTDLEVALNATDTETAAILANQVIALWEQLAPEFGPLPEAVRAQARPDELSIAVEVLCKDSGEAVYLRFGEWTEAAELAVGAGDPAFVRSETVERFKKELEASGAPVGTLRDLSRLAEGQASSGAGVTDSARLLADIKEMF